MSTPPKFTTTTWLIIIIASIGFLFDTYELLMTPLVAAPAIAELLKVPLNNPMVTDWVGKLLWIAALCGGVFGLLGGWLVDRFGRKKIMAASIFLYSFSPFCAAFATSLPMFVFFRSTTFIGVCVEFVAAITWLAEVFPDKKDKEKWLGITQAFASLGGLLVTGVSVWISKHGAELPHWGLPVGLGATDPGSWRYLLMTGILPAIPIALLLPFVPESQVWKDRRAAGSLKRPSFGALFAPELRRVTLVTAALSACAYGIAFGALQVTVARVTPGLPELRETSKTLAPLRKEAEGLNLELNKLAPTDPARKDLIAKIKENFGKSKPHNDKVKEMADKVQLRQELGGLVGRIILAVLLIWGISRVALLKIFQIPALILLPLTYFKLFEQGGSAFLWAYGICGLLTVAQFSYFGEYLPKVFPLHLRGTGGSFATNVGGRMIGTSMAFVTTSFVAPMLAGNGPLLPSHVAMAAGYVGTAIAVISFLVGFLLPEPKAED
ncbi:MFS transporter [Brevifollis gellanilyticus]|uniref:MFS transporter n=1 Tax=Brevifollis gellanilyticus TaxID=748831 RepID=A0A512MH54_9BACT|nr:MFS transporter [Brevifollis gellanilyticus]GEP46070.1 MFS transporter [Brevifollis gellanilyticus]